MNPSHRFRRDFMANLVGRGWSAVMALAFVPVYLRALGPEAYGLVAVYTILQAAFSVVDIGLTTTLNRELAISKEVGSKDGPQVLRTLEILYWLLALAAAVLIMTFAGWFAANWVKAAHIPAAEIKRVVMIMGMVLAVQWPFGFYAGGLLGLQEQLLYNVFLVVTSTLRYAGAAIVLLFVSNTLVAFFFWQLGVSTLAVLACAATIWNRVGRRSSRAKFSFSVALEVWRFTAGMGAISATALILTQIDKILLSRLLPLAEFGYYSLAALVAGSLYTLILPVSTAVFPALTRAVASDNEHETVQLYHRASQLVAVVTMPVACVLAVFSTKVLFVWTRDASGSERMGPVLGFLSIGVALNGLMSIPYVLQLANGWTRLTLTSNLIAIALVVPALLVLAPRYGAPAAALAWLTLNAGYILCQLHFMHRRLLRGELKRWYLKDVGKPTTAAAIVVLAAGAIIPASLSRPAEALALVFVALTGACAALLVAPDARGLLLRVGKEL